MSKLNEAKEQYRNTYKQVRFMETGTWTEDDEKALDKECASIEFRATLKAIGIVVVITLFMLGLMALLVGFMVK